MKKIMLIGFVVFLAMLLSTCDGLFPGGDDNKVIDYTDVEYSEDGSFVTVYLDGSKPVPVTAKSQRAMTTNLSKMAYDYIEVLFVSGTTRARSAWEIGQSAGISGVHRGTGTTNTATPPVTAVSDDGNYLLDFTNTDGSADHPLALMFVGRKDGKTLLGIGRILQVDRLPKLTNVAGGLPTLATTDLNSKNVNAYDAGILDSTKSVTFWIESVKTGLLIKDEITYTTAALAKAANTPFVAYDSFTNKEPTGTPLATTPADNLVAGTPRGDATRSPLGKSSYPLYPLKVPTTTTPEPDTLAFFTFGGAADTFKKFIRLEDYPVVEKRFPRYLDGGRYLAPQSNVDTDSEVVFVKAATTTPAAGEYAGIPYLNATATPWAPTPGTFSNIIPLKFTSKGYGVFSFYIEIPVFLFIKTNFLSDASEAATKATNGGDDAVIWKIRTGLGSELYSLDDGLSSGGCILVGVGVSALDWLEIEWEWLK